MNKSLRVLNWQTTVGRPQVLELSELIRLPRKGVNTKQATAKSERVDGQSIFRLLFFAASCGGPHGNDARFAAIQHG
ncbi:MAG: hypothetical protein ACYTGL_19605 [Planctomycetota bacterium]|jgi:hypothetical protein